VGTLHEYVRTFMIISRWILLKCKTFRTKAVERIKTRISYFITFPENCADYEVKCKNMVQPDRPLMRFSCWMPKATDTYLEYVIPIAFPRQKWFRERALCVACVRTLPVLFKNTSIDWMSWNNQILEHNIAGFTQTIKNKLRLAIAVIKIGSWSQYGMWHRPQRTHHFPRCSNQHTIPTDATK